jgi:hypothetical protein
MMKACPSATCQGEAITDYAAAFAAPPGSVLLARSEVREALSVWYPAQSRRRQLHELRKVSHHRGFSIVCACSSCGWQQCVVCLLQSLQSWGGVSGGLCLHRCGVKWRALHDGRSPRSALHSDDTSDLNPSSALN